MDKSASSSIAGFQLRKRKHTASDDKNKENNNTLTSISETETVSASINQKQQSEPNVKQDCLNQRIGIGWQKFAKITLEEGKIKIDIRKYENREALMECKGSAKALLELLERAGVADGPDYARAAKKSTELSPTIDGVSLTVDQLDKLLPILQDNLKRRWAEEINESNHIGQKEEHHYLGRSLYAFCFSKSKDSFTCLKLRHCSIGDDGFTIVRSKIKGGIDMDEEEAVNLVDILDGFYRIIHAA